MILALALIVGPILAPLPSPGQAENARAQTGEGKDSPLAKVGGALAQLYEEYQSYVQEGGGGEFAATNSFLPVAGTLVLIDAAASGGAGVLQTDLEALALQSASRFGSIVSGRLPISAIPQLAALDSLQFARPAYFTTHVGLTTSQGDAAMRADVARLAFGVDGTGVTVGVLSDSFDCLGGAAGDV